MSEGLTDSVSNERDRLKQAEEAAKQKIEWNNKLEIPQVTWRATAAGLVVGTVVLISNFQFGLQTGWVSMMSLPSALLGYICFRVTPWGKSFSDVENVYVQSVSVAVGTGPLAYGLVGIVPAIEKFLTAEETGTGSAIRFSTDQLILWSLGLALFGVFFAVPLRKQVIVKERLPFPSGSATAVLISVLHGTKIRDEESIVNEERSKDPNYMLSTPEEHTCHSRSDLNNSENNSSFSETLALMPHQQTDTISNSTNLLYTFLISSFYTIMAYFFPILRNIPIFGTYLSSEYKWNIQPSPAYIGQGIIMGLPTVSYMVFGSVLGWGILAPFAKYMNWAPGDISDYQKGGQGWVLWVSLSIMISDSLVSFLTISIRSITGLLNGMKIARKQAREALEVSESLLLHEEGANSSDNASLSVASDIYKDIVPEKHMISTRVVVMGVIASSLLCVACMRIIFDNIVPYYSMFIGVILALFFSILGVRALGETDLNPVSGIGKLSQFIFALVIPASNPSRVLINVIAGGIAEAGAQQAGDLMQDLKAGNLLGASPKAQFKAQLIGTIYSVFVSSFMYKVYNAVYDIPNENYRIPTAAIWIDCARLVTGEGLPPKALQFSLILGSLFGAVSFLKNNLSKSSKYHDYLVYLPNGVAVGVGMYNTPNITLARFIGGLVAYWWMNHKHTRLPPSDNKTNMIIFSSGLVLGEGLLSAFTMLLTSLNVKHF